MKNIPITPDLQQSFNYIKANSLIKERQKSSSHIEGGECMIEKKSKWLMKKRMTCGIRCLV
ncbi:Uncharacterised protein [Enterococcus durans]|uniref:Uncharacterized protein n=1 Tax=Enterococcus durans TaxID=53345 RepID=A0A377KHC0_9ENTE|nr:Uncharacterised protein [Enterococcus durans]